MELALKLIFGLIAYLALMWVLLAIMRLEKTPPQDDDEQAKAVSKPAPLERQHVKAGTAWGREL